MCTLIYVHSLKDLELLTSQISALVFLDNKKTEPNKIFKCFVFKF